MKIIHCRTPQFIDEEWKGRIHEYCSRVITPEVTPLWRNYQEDWLDFDGHLIFSVMVGLSDEILAFCGIYNGGRYPHGVYRILNRKFVDPAFRKKKIVTPSMKWRTFDLVNEQLALVKPYLDIVFVSFEKESRRRVFSPITKKISLVRPSAWREEPGRFRVAPGDGPSCFQVVMWANLTSRYRSLPLEGSDGKIPEY